MLETPALLPPFKKQGREKKDADEAGVTGQGAEYTRQQPMPSTSAVEGGNG
ncbi:MAG: hypothetical protein UT95_C0003G0004 [Candidatus Curtissbacteria bacterium GW2011_GWB1_40_28]|nr:MAG: hypothetical protein UT95_C0003G0004 [Candidatus Curtissbacteria bacterium GW2011_GWB1_40_28]